ncbi:MAG: sialate O-acetylesterase [Bacteroidota bacterium]|nr:sialate O-acetylesterase [Bacteroidota bacterium]
MKIKLFGLLGLLISFSGYSQVHLAKIFGDHMVLQRSQPVMIWGWSSPNEKITVRINDQVKEGKADKNGKWGVNLDPQPAGGPYDLTVAGKDSVVFHDVLIGEVWICSGQSNMEFELKSAMNAATEIKEADYPQIRQIKVPKTVSLVPKGDIPSGEWTVCSPQTAGDYTAVGYFFAREIQKRLHVAVGLINSSWGGTMVETWTSRGAFEKSPEFKTMIASVPNTDIETMIKQRKQGLEDKVKSLEKGITDSLPESDWKNPQYNSEAWPKMKAPALWETQDLGLDELDGVVWFRKEITLDAAEAAQPLTLNLGKIDDNDNSYVNGIPVGSTKGYDVDRHYTVAPGVFKEGRNVIAVRVEDTNGGGGFYGDSASLNLSSSTRTLNLSGNWSFRIARIDQGTGNLDPNAYPTLLYNAMIQPLIPYGIRGVLWYQGETNAGRAYEYRTAFPLMITDWRQHWNQGNFPFYFVQLASFNAGNGDSEHGSTWAELREAQTRTLSLPNTGMAVTTDIGESHDIHPKNKQDVGKRLAAIALNNIYGQPMQYSGPVYESMTVEGNKVILTFTHTGSGLMIKDKYGYLRGFEVSGDDHHFHYAKASISGNKVIVSAESVIEPTEVRYAWADDASDANLYNQEGFPAGSFRTDQWKGITDDVKYKIGE